MNTRDEEIYELVIAILENTDAIPNDDDNILYEKQKIYEHCNQIFTLLGK